MTLAKRSFLSLFSKRESLEDWLKDLSKRLETDLNNVMRDKLNDGVLDIAESIQQMAKIIVHRSYEVRKITTATAPPH